MFSLGARAHRVAFGGVVPSVVLLNYYYPPLVGIASERAASMAGHLCELGWHPAVVTAANGFYHRADEASTPSYPVIRTRSFELSRAFRRAFALSRAGVVAGEGSTITPVPTGALGGGLRELVRDFAYVPDAQVGWIPFAAQAVRRTLELTPRPRVVFSTSVPFSAHLAARAGAHGQDVGWVAEFRDPWATSDSPSRSSRRLRRSFDARLERRVLLAADHIIATSESFRAELLQTHAELGPGRVSVVTNGFEDMPAGKPPGATEPMVVLYAGTVAAGEDVSPVITAFSELDERHPQSTRLRVLGPPEPWRFAAGESVPAWLELAGIVTPSAARQAMTDSSALLLFQRHPGYDCVLPGKAFEYIGARRPIVAVVPSASEMAELLTRHADVRLVDRDDVTALNPVLDELLRQHRSGSLQAPRVTASTVAPLARREQAERLAGILARFVR